MKGFLLFTAALAALIQSGAWAADGSAAAAPAAAQTAQAQPAARPKKAVAKSGDAPAYMFAKPVVLRGTLGDQKIQAHVRPKEDIMEGIEGDYFVFGDSRKILLAGDLTRGELVMEESEDGKNISGRWIGAQEGNTLRGTWTSSADVSKPFVLTVVSDRAGLQRANAVRPKAAAPALPAAPAMQ